MIGLLARKIGMTQIFDEAGRVVPVTLFSAGPCKIVQVKTPKRDGYAALQLGFGARREKCQTAAVKGHLKKGSASGMRTLREVRVDDTAAYQEGQELNVSLFEIGALVDVIGTSKGRGFAGVVKRHHFSGGRETIAEHRKKGGVPEIDVSYQYLYSQFEPDDKKIQQIYEDYKAGRMLTGELKQILIEKMESFLAEHERKRERAKRQVDKFLK